MCGRFTLTHADAQTVASALGAWIDPASAASYRPRFNVGPNQPCWVVTLDPARPTPARRFMSTATWGLPIAETSAVINARCETVHVKPSFAEAFWTGRCGVAADGFIEWTGPKGSRRPLWFHRPDGRPFLMAGIHRDVVGARGEVERRFAILTTRANETVGEHHPRMPVILPPGRVDAWLRVPTQRGPDAVAAAQALFEPAPAPWLAMTEVNPRINDVRNDDPACLDAVSPDDGQQNLF